MKLSEWARQQGIHYQTAYRWYKEKNLPVKAYQTPTGTIIIQQETSPSSEKSNEAHVYCRVSSYEKKDDLERQTERCVKFCEVNGWTIASVTKEVASGMNDNRPKLNKLLESQPKRIIVEHKDRLTRFGFNYFNLLLPKLGCDLVVINQDETEEKDLMKDLISVITSFCCRLYGMRRGYQKAKIIKEEVVKSN